MRTARTRLAFSVLIVIAMVSSGLGVSSIVLSRGTAPAVSGPTGTVGTRSEGASTPVSLTGLTTNEVQADNLPTQITPTIENKPTVTRLEPEEIMSNMKQSDSTITATIVDTETGTRNPFFDAGGPYGGPTCFEGSCTIHFEITTDDPTLIFFRWDFNNDGVWDTSWLTDMFKDVVMYDNYYGNVKAEGWDGFSTTTFILTGYNLYPAQNYYWGFYGPTVAGWKFRAKVTMDATDLYFFFYYQTMPSLTIRIWDYPASAELGSCQPTSQATYSWTTCTLGAPIHLVLAHEYIIEADNTDGVSSWLLFNNPNVPWDKVEYQNMFYDWSPGSMPQYDWGGGATYVPMIDFKWRQVLTVPLTQQDTAFLDVNNVAPQPFGIMTTPSPALEGSPVKASAWFNDPGLDDTWQYRWYWGDGSWSPWADVDKFNGGANVLIYHTITGNLADLKTKFAEQCGAFCKKIDDYDFGPLGQNKHLTLADFMKYDVIYIAENYFPTISMAPLGDALADYVDQKGDQGSGGVVLEAGALISGTTAITGRWGTDGYYPVKPAAYAFQTTNIGTIYVPGHPLLDGISTLVSAMQANAYSVTAGATRVSDWTNGKVMLATKLDPIVDNGARIVALNDFAPWYQCSGDCHRIVVNAVKWASRQPDPTPMTMPIQLPWTSHIYMDDDPVTTSPQDAVQLKVEVKDDDHLKVEGISSLVGVENFETGCNYNSFPNGWVNTPNYGFRCEYVGGIGSNAANFWYYYNYNSIDLLESPAMDMSMFTAVRLQWTNYWYAYYYYPFDGYVEVSFDGGLTYPTLLKAFHSADGSIQQKKVYAFDIPAVSDQMKVRFRLEAFGYYEWAVDDITVYGIMGRIVQGLGEVWGSTMIANVPPTIVGGPTSGTFDEATPFTIAGMQISDPAIMQPTEWTAYKMDFDDGTPAQWVYKGSLAPPKVDILFVHFSCITGNTCSSYTNIANRLLGMDLVGSVTGYNWGQTLTAPTLSYLLQFDVILYAIEWAYSGNSQFDAAKLLIGNRFADYLDAHRGGIVTFMATFDNSASMGELWSLTGRYIDEGYGPFVKGEVYLFSAASLGTIHYPDHPVMQGVKDVTTGNIHSGNLGATATGIRLASWNDGGAAVGVNDYQNDGKRSCAINVYTPSYGGADATKLLRQCVGWAIGGIPSPEIPKVTHTWGDNGKYTVGLTLIDDDMGWTWDAVGNAPVADPRYPQTLSFYSIPLEVNNVNPTIHSTAAYTEAELCIRMAGNKGNDATLTVMGTDGSYYTVTTTRVPGQPAVGCLPKIQVDMTPNTKYQLDIAYDPTGDESGANPEWIFQGEFPDGKIKELRHTFNSNDGPSVWTIGNKEFKALAIGSPLTFEAMASDPGSDDLVFAWIWGDVTPYDLHIYAHPGVFYTYASSDQLNLLPFQEPTFIFADNSVRSPSVDPIRAQDTATHQFVADQMPYFLYVMLIVADDDNGNPYSSPYLWPGMDLEVIQIDI